MSQPAILKPGHDDEAASSIEGARMQQDLSTERVTTLLPFTCIYEAMNYRPIDQLGGETPLSFLDPRWLVGRIQPRSSRGRGRGHECGTWIMNPAPMTAQMFEVM